MNQPQFFITDVQVAGPARIRLAFADGFAAEVNLAAMIASHPVLARLADPDVFNQVGLDEWQRGVMFAGEDDLTLASDNLRAMAVEQAGEFSHQQVIIWMAHHGMTLDAAAQALDISRRMLAYYRSGEKPIPRSVGLAMLGWDIVQLRGQEHAFEYELEAA